MRLLWLVSVLFALAGAAGGAARPTRLLVWPLVTTPGAPAETDVEIARPPSALTIELPDGYDVTASPPGTVDVELDLRHALTNPGKPGIYVWRAGDASSAVVLPQLLTLRARHAAGQLVVAGRLVAAGQPRAGVNIHVDVSSSPDFATHTESVARTRADGSFTLRVSRRAATEYVVASVSFYAAGTETVAPPPAAYAITTGA